MQQNIISKDATINQMACAECNYLSKRVYHPFLNLINTIICFDILLITIAFILSFGNILIKDPYMSKNCQLPLHCIIYFLLGFLLSYMCLKKVQEHCHFYRHFLIVCLIFSLMFTFFFLQLTYNDHQLNLFIRIFLSAGSSLFLLVFIQYILIMKTKILWIIKKCSASF